MFAVPAVVRRSHGFAAPGRKLHCARRARALLFPAGGASLTVGSVGTFTKDMSSGLGYIALAAMIFGRWTPLGATAAALLFGFTNSLQATLSTINVPVSSFLLLMAPYVATIIAVAGLVGRVRAPAADGKPYVKA